MSQTSVELFVNADAVIEAAEYIGEMGRHIKGRVIDAAYDVVAEAIDSVFSIAVREADAYDGFPREFQNHVMRVAHRIQPSIFFDGNEIFISIDLETQMGDYDSLKRAYHQGAVLADGKTKLDGPYTGQALLTDDDEKRHEFWEAIRFGASTYTTFDRKRGKSVIRPIKDSEGKWERTKQKYLEIWGDEAPEWLFMQFGQHEWEPTVPEIDIVGRLQDSINYSMTEQLFYLVAREVEIANSFHSRGLEVRYTKGQAPRVVSGTAELNGKVYRPGRYAPKGGF